MTFSEKNCNTCGQKCAIKYHGCSNWIPISDAELLIPISVLDKIRAEIEQEITYKPIDMWDYRMGLTKALEIIEKNKTESGVGE